MATRMDVVSLVQQTIEHPLWCITEMSKYAMQNYTLDVPYSHIWTSCIANKVGLADSQAPLTASCDKGANWFRRRKRYKLGQAYGGDYIPQPGDYIYFSSTYEQADATDVGIVMDNDGTIITFVCWDFDNGCPNERTYYLSDPIVIGYGIPDCEDVVKVDMPALAMQGNGVVVIGEDDYVYAQPYKEMVRVGMLKRGYAVEVLEATPTGWLRVVWGLSPSGYAFINNTSLIHKIIQDEVPYQRYEGFKIGNRVQFRGGKIYRTKKEKSKSKINAKPFIAKISGTTNERYYIEEQTGAKRKGWVDKLDVDFIPEFGYNPQKGEIVTDEAYLRIGPGIEFTKVQKWPQMAIGNVVDVLGSYKDDEAADEWLVVVINGVRGYVNSNCVKFIEV